MSSSQHQILTDILSKRRDRAIAIVLGCKERDVDPLLASDRHGREASVKLRKVVLDQFNDLTDLCVDLMRSLDNDSAAVLNEHYLRKIDELHEVLVLDG